MVPAPEKILVVHSNEEVIRGIGILLRNQPTLELVATATNLQHGAHWARISQPDVIILDSDMPGMCPTWAVALLREAAPEARYLVLGDPKSTVARKLKNSPVEVEVIGPNDSVQKFLACLKRRPIRPATANSLFPKAAA